ncbi:MAG: septum formation initiator family protein [Candidatus Eiseniibacteriota bacterium]|nr:MAG: septum formation initiator family protein [Candidatus Eisenbacteria bacterium]
MRDVAGRIKKYRLVRYRRPEPKARRTLLRLLLIALCVWLAYQVIASEHGLIKISRTKSEIQELDREAASLVNEKEELDETAKTYENNPYLVEKALRDELGMAKEDEIVYRFEDEKEEEEELPVVEPEKPAEKDSSGEKGKQPAKGKR